MATAVLALWGFARVGSGVDSAACASVGMLGATLSGQSSPPFQGAVGLLDSFWALNESLRNSSGDLEEMDAIVDRTANISRAVAVASETLRLLEETAGSRANLEPRHAASNASLLHRCHFCADLPRLLAPARAALAEGAGAAMARAREAVGERLAPERRAVLLESVRLGAEPLAAAKERLRWALAFFSAGGGYEHVQDQVRGGQLGASVTRLAVLVLGFLAVGFGCSNWLMLTCVRHDLLEQDGEKSGATKRSYASRVAGCAFSSWCCSFWYVLGAWLAGAFLLAVAAPLSGACLVLEDMDGQTLREIAPAFELNLPGDQGALAEGFVDRCLNPSASVGGDADLLKVVFARENGTAVTMHQRVAAEVVGPLSSSFGRLCGFSNASYARLADHPALLQLRARLREGRVAELLVAEEAAVRSRAPLGDLALGGGLDVSFSASTACADYNASEGLGLHASSLAGVVPGIQTVASRLSALGSAVPGTGCARSVTCSSQLNASEARACAAGNEYMELKRQLIASGSFRCNVFQLPNGSACDPLHMRRSGGAWLDDCLGADGTAELDEVPCSLAEFVQYMKDYDDRLQLVVERLDLTALEVQQEIGSKLDRIVRERVLTPLDGIVDGARCDFLAEDYRQLVDGLCYEGVYGLWVVGWSYIACGVLVALLMPLIYGVWLRATSDDPWPSPRKARGVAAELGRHGVVPGFEDELELEGVSPKEKVMRYTKPAPGDHEGRV